VMEIAKTIIYPAAMRYLSEIAKTNSRFSILETEIDLDKSIASTIAEETNAMVKAINELSEVMQKEEFASVEEHMQYCANEICGLMNEVRIHADALEAEISDEQWPLPKYREMLFIK